MAINEALIHLCGNRIGLDGTEVELLQILCENTCGGEAMSLGELIELENKLGIELDEQPAWIIEEDGRVYVSSVIIDYLNERIPMLPVGAELRLCSEQTKYGIDAEIKKATSILSMLEKDEEGAVICVMGAEGSGREFFLEQLAVENEMHLLAVEIEGFLSANALDKKQLARAVDSIVIASLLYTAVPYIKCNRQLISQADFPVDYEYAGLRNPLELVRQLAMMTGVLGLVIGGNDGGKNKNELSAEYIDFGKKSICITIPENTGEQRRNIAEAILKESEIEGKELIKLIHIVSGINLPTAAYVRLVHSVAVEYKAGIAIADITERIGNKAGNESLRYLKADRDLNELKLPEKQKAELGKICKLCIARDKVLNEGGFSNKFSYGNGLSVLFYGAPGTGKTMAAQVIAATLGKPLYRVELSQLINKYVGETQKNIGRIFDEASKNDCVLLFDEADAIFAKRGEVADAQDRYSNAETAYLLQRMESYTGICVLTTNLLQNFDEAFRRRITYMINFPMPDASIRFELWSEIFPEATKVGASVDRKLLADTFELSGAAIRNIAQHAALLAAAEEYEEVQMPHILDGILNEYSKTGRNLTNTQRDIISSWI